MKAETVLSTLDLKDAHLARLTEAVRPARLLSVDRKDDAGIRAALAEADVALLFGDLDERVLSAPKLKWVHCDHAGLNKSARPEVFAKGLLVTSSAGRSSPALADHAIFFMLALSFRFGALYEAQRKHQWGIPGQDDLRGLTGRTLGIVGLGNTGRALALRAKAMDMRVLGYRRSDGPIPEGVDAAYTQDNGDTLEPLLRESDYVVLAVPLSDRTYHLIDAAALAQMKQGAYLVNMARGAVIDDVALLAALREGRLAGAGLDTFEPEPLPAESPLWEAPNVLITPHFTPQVPDRTGRSLDIICENLRRYRADEPMLNRLKPDDVYTRGLTSGGAARR